MEYIYFYYIILKNIKIKLIIDIFNTIYKKLINKYIYYL